MVHFNALGDNKHNPIQTRLSHPYFLAHFSAYFIHDN